MADTITAVILEYVTSSLHLVNSHPKMDKFINNGRDFFNQPCCSYEVHPTSIQENKHASLCKAYSAPVQIKHVQLPGPVLGSIRKRCLASVSVVTGINGPHPGDLHFLRAYCCPGLFLHNFDMHIGLKYDLHCVSHRVGIIKAHDQEL